jgi:hypothetical protein
LCIWTFAEENVMKLEEILLTALASAVFTGVLAFLFQSWIGELFSKRLDRFRKDLKRDAFEHEIRFTKLHEKRAEVVAHLYELLVDLDRAFKPETDFNPLAEKPTLRETIIAINEAGWQFWDYFDRHRLYLSDGLCGKLEEVRQQYRNAWRALIKSSLQLYDETLKRQEHWLRAVELTEKAIRLKSSIETEFRNMLGVENGATRRE